MLSLSHISAVYALRWEIELLFRELKTIYRIARRGTTECLFNAALLALALSRRLQKLVTRDASSILRPSPPEATRLLPACPRHPPPLPAATTT
jgi:IS4 transposase